MFRNMYDGILNPNQKEINLHIRMMAELCRLRGTPARIETSNGLTEQRMVLIEDNPTSSYLKSYGFNNHSNEADEMVCHVALVEKDPLLNYPPVVIKAGMDENKGYRVGEIKITFDKRYFMTLTMYPYSKPSEIRLANNSSRYGAEGRVSNVSGKDCDMGMRQVDIVDNTYSDDKIVTEKPMITSRRRFGEEV